jgi:hypothetical protein
MVAGRERLRGDREGDDGEGMWVHDRGGGGVSLVYLGVDEALWEAWIGVSDLFFYFLTGKGKAERQRVRVGVGDEEMTIGKIIPRGAFGIRGSALSME